MSRLTMIVALAGALLSGAGVAAAQTAPSGQFGQRTSSGAYLPSTNDPGCQGIICSSLPSLSPTGGAARGPSEVAPPPPCQGLICGLTPYGMERPYTAAQAAEVERQQRAAAQTQGVAQSAPAPRRQARKRKGKAVKAAARTPAPETTGGQ